MSSMALPENFSAARSAFLEAATIRKVTIDDISDVRHLHAWSIQRHMSAELSEDEIDAFREYVYSTAYTDRLCEAAVSGRLIAATLPNSPELLATSGWNPTGDAGATARLFGIFSSPLYAGHGLAALVLRHAETIAADAGCSTLSIRCPVGASGFFVSQGFDIASQGAWPLGQRNVSIHVAFLRKSIRSHSQTSH